MICRRCHKVRPLKLYTGSPNLKFRSLPDDFKVPSLLRKPATPISSELIVVDRDGEMPEGAPLPTSLPTSQKPSRSTTPNGVLHQPLPSFPLYVVDDEIPRTGTPEPIKVTRVKKKGTGKKSVKRTVEGS